MELIFISVISFFKIHNTPVTKTENNLQLTSALMDIFSVNSRLDRYYNTTLEEIKETRTDKTKADVSFFLFGQFLSI